MELLKEAPGLRRIPGLSEDRAGEPEGDGLVPCVDRQDPEAGRRWRGEGAHGLAKDREGLSPEVPLDAEYSKVRGIGEDLSPGRVPQGAEGVPYAKRKGRRKGVFSWAWRHWSAPGVPKNDALTQHPLGFMDEVEPVGHCSRQSSTSASGAGRSAESIHDITLVRQGVPRPLSRTGATAPFGATAQRPWRQDSAPRNPKWGRTNSSGAWPGTPGIT